jgi:hypothetical protein
MPHNVLIIDVSVYERCLFKAGLRGAMLDAKTGLPRQPASLLSLRSMLQSLHVPLDFALHNSGNDSFACLLAFQMLVDPQNTQVPPPRTQPPGMVLNSNFSYPSVPLLSPGLSPSTMAFSAIPRSLSAPHVPFDIGENLTIPPRSASFPNRLSIGDTHVTNASPETPDEEGRIIDVQDALSSKFARATVG